MGEIGETMVMAMQGSSLEGGERTLLEFLRDGMDGVARVERRRSLKERLGLTRFGCCGAHWGFGFGFGFGPIVLDDDDDESPQQQPLIPTPAPAANSCDGDGNLSPVGANADVAEAAGMNLAAALAAERQFRAAQDSDGELSPGPSPSPVGLEISGADIGPTQNRISLMRLLHETECEELEGEDREKVSGCDMACCVCMGRKKGAAFIPCGHTFCRVCSRELWLNRGSCPLCNRPILEILDIF